MSFTITKPNCPCHCVPPDLLFEFKVLNAQADELDEHAASASVLMAALSFDMIGWGGEASNGAGEIEALDNVIDSLTVLGGSTAPSLIQWYTQIGVADYGDLTRVNFKQRVAIRVSFLGTGHAWQFRWRTVEQFGDDWHYDVGPTQSWVAGEAGDEGTRVYLTNAETGYLLDDPLLTGGTSYRFFAGRPGRGLAVLDSRHVGDGTTIKQGFPTFARLPAPEARIYRKQTASGSFPGCDARGLAAKNYSGSIEYPAPSADEEHPAEPDDTLSDDVKATGAQSRYYLAKEQPRLFGKITETDVTRQCRQTMACGDDTVADELNLALDEEYTTGELRFVAAQKKDAGLLVDSDDAGPVYAMDVLSTDQTSYGLRAERHQYHAGELYAFVTAGTFDLVFRRRKRVIGADGTVSATEETVALGLGSLTLPGIAGQGTFIGENTDPAAQVTINFTADSGKQVRWDQLQCDEETLINGPFGLEPPPH